VKRTLKITLQSTSTTSSARLAKEGFQAWRNIDNSSERINLGSAELEKNSAISGLETQRTRITSSTSKEESTSESGSVPSLKKYVSSRSVAVGMHFN
jgi:hypothetical protein